VSDNIGRIGFTAPSDFQVDARHELTEVPCGSSGDGALMLVLAASRDPVALGPLGSESVLDMDPREARQQITLHTLPLSAPLHYLTTQANALTMLPGYELKTMAPQRVRGQTGARASLVHGAQVPIIIHTYAWIQGDELVVGAVEGPAALGDELLVLLKDFIAALTFG